MVAGASGDRSLAREFARSYQVRPLSQLRRQFEIRETILRHTLAEDREGEAALAAMLKPGYQAGYPRPLIEFPLGVVQQDAGMVREAVRKLSVSMKGQWDVRKHRAWYDKRVAQYAARGRSYPETWEQCLEHTKSALLGGHWVFSWWAVAWLNIARWRGMDEVFEDRKVFSEWVPAVE